MTYKILDGNVHTLERTKCKFALELYTSEKLLSPSPYLYTNCINKKVMKLLYICIGFNRRFFVDYKCSNFYHYGNTKVENLPNFIKNAIEIYIRD